MMRNKGIHFMRSRAGLSLFETIMALVLGAMVFLPLTMAFNVAIKVWNEHIINDELHQHARVAMDRLTSELRYAIRIEDSGFPDKLWFRTRNLIDDNWDSELIKYEKLEIVSAPKMDALKRSEEGSPFYTIAGSDLEPRFQVTNFDHDFYKVAGGNLQVLGGLDTMDDVEVVEVNLTVANEDMTKSITLVSRVDLRYKQNYP